MLINTKIDVQGDELSIQRGDLIITRSLSSIADELLAPIRVPKFTLNETEVNFLVDNLKDSENLCPQRKVTYTLESFGLGHTLTVVDGDDKLICESICKGCRCL